MELRWSLPAAEDLERICERIEHDNPDVARRVAQKIYEGWSTTKLHRSQYGGNTNPAEDNAGMET